MLRWTGESPVATWVGGSHGLDFQVAVFCFFVLFFVSFFGVFEVFVLPLGVAQGGFVYSVGVDYDFGFDYGLEIGAVQVERRGLQGVEQEAGGFGLELAGEDEAHDLHEGDLNGVSVLEDGQGESKAVGRFGVQLDALALPVFVKEAKAASAKSRRAALGAVGFDMSAARDIYGIRHDKCSTPLPRGLAE